MKYIKKFNTTGEYESYMNNEPHLPNVSLVTETLKVSLTPAMGGGEITFPITLEEGVTDPNVVIWLHNYVIKNGTPNNNGNLHYVFASNEVVNFKGEFWSGQVTYMVDYSGFNAVYNYTSLLGVSIHSTGEIREIAQ